MKRILFLSAGILCLQAFAPAVSGQGVPAPHTIRLQPFLSGLSLPVHIVNAKDGTNRLFVVQQRGIIKVVQPGANTTTDFMSLVGVVSSSGNERGLLGLAFHPQYSTNRKFYVYYTRLSDGAIEIAEYETFAANPNQGDLSTVRPIITIPHTLASNHNGGTIAFGPDGFLYAGTGDGGSANDPQGNAQNINSLLGKILRIDINSVTPPYVSPSTNPYFGATAGADEIYAVGMRNPYRFSFDRGGTFQLWVGDVGQDAIEEVDRIALGGNYGWRVYEGNQCTGLDPTLCTPTNYLPPVFQYNSGGGDPRCSVTGGYVYRGTQNTLVNGNYLYADYCTGEIFLWNGSTQTMMLDTSRNISSFGEDEAGELYVVGLGGTVEKVVRARASADLDGDLRSDFAVYRPSTGFWYAFHSSNGSIRQQQFGGNAGDIAVPEDLDGDNITDIGYFRPSGGGWHYFRSSNSTIQFFEWGVSGDVPVAGDYDGDAKADFAIFRPSTGVWAIRKSSGGEQYAYFGLASDRPVAGDYDGDGRYDVSVFRDSDGVWYRLNSSNGAFVAVHWGMTGDVPAPGDFDGDGRLDQAVFRPSTNIWYMLRSTSGFQAIQWGLSADIPVAGDYDADARDDIAVFRPSTGTWYVLRSSNGVLLAGQFGQSGDAPLPAYDTP